MRLRNMWICIYNEICIKIMDIKSKSKVDISFWNIAFKKIRSGEKEKTNEYTNWVYPNGSIQY